MTPLVPGHYTILQPYLTGGGQVRLRCRRCWNEWDMDLPRLPRPEKHDTLRGRCPQCNTDQKYDAKA